MKNEGDDKKAPSEKKQLAATTTTITKKKVKKSSSIIKKLKLKGKSSSSPNVSQAIAPVPESVVLPEEDNVAKAVSNIDLDKISWHDTESVEPESISTSEVVASTSKSVINIESKEVINHQKQEDESTERTKSLENLQTMPAFGELILDATNLMSNQNNVNTSRDHLYKILVIGDLGAGKTSIIKRYVHDFFTQHYRATIGVDFALKVLHWDSNTVIRLQLWDIAGQERYGNMTRVYYKEAVGAFIVFDVTRSNTLDSVANWKADLDSKVQLADGSTIPCVLLGNKCDQQKEGIVNSSQKMNEYCKEKGFTAWFETSAKENINIEEAANALISKILQNDVILNNDTEKDKDQFILTAKEDNQNGRKCAKC